MLGRNRYRRSSLRLSHCTKLRLNTKEAWEGPATTVTSLNIVQDNRDKKVSINESKSEIEGRIGMTTSASDDSEEG